jgi:hypothetical protein
VIPKGARAKAQGAGNLTKLKKLRRVYKGGQFVLEAVEGDVEGTEWLSALALL